MAAATKRMAGLKSALEEAAGGRAGAAVRATPATAKTASAEKAGSRSGKIHVGAWLSPDFKTSLRMVQIKTAKSGERGFQDLVAEALNDLFAKYDVPTVGE
jgi:hypothetical protein